MAFGEAGGGDSAEKSSVLGTPAAPKLWEWCLSLYGEIVLFHVLHRAQYPTCSLSVNPHESLMKQIPQLLPFYR